MRTSEGGMARMGVSWDTPGDSGEKGRIRGQKGTYYGEYQGLEKELPAIQRPPLPPGVKAGGHGGSHPHLAHEFLRALVEDRDPFPNARQSANWTAVGILAYESAMEGGKRVDLPAFTLK